MKLKHPFPAFILPFLLYSCTVVKPSAPDVADATIPGIEQPVSNIEVPVSVDLKSYIRQAESSVPNKYAGHQQQCEGLSYSYTFLRTPFTITGSNNVVNLKFMGSYGFTASYCAKCASLFGTGPQCMVPTVKAQCGVGEPLRRMEISYQSTILVKPDYHLQSKTILYPAPNPLDRCNVFLGNIDVTDRLINYLNDPLSDLGKQVDARIAAYNIKPVIELLWKNIASEYQVGDVGYLSVNPQSVRLSSFNLSGSMLNFSVGISAKPVVTIASKPQLLKPLPNLSTYVPAKGFNIYLDLLENYNHLSNVVNQQVIGQKIDVAGKEFIVDSTQVYGICTKIVLRVDFSGSNTGTIYLVGTPSYNASTHVLSFPDLEFDLKTKAWMLKTAKWLFNGKITSMIRQRATYNFSSFMADNKTKLQSQLSHDMGNNARSVVSIQDMDIQSIYPTSQKLIVRTLIDGQIKVNVAM
jgi:hypothetical protein